MNGKDSIAKQLADAHRDGDPGIVRIARITTPGDENPAEPIKLLEVNTATFASGIVPIALGSSDSVPYPSVIVELTPAEFEQLGKELKLPEGWSVGETLYDATSG